MSDNTPCECNVCREKFYSIQAYSGHKGAARKKNKQRKNKGPPDKCAFGHYIETFPHAADAKHRLSLQSVREGGGGDEGGDSGDSSSDIDLDGVEAILDEAEEAGVANTTVGSQDTAMGMGSQDTASQDTAESKEEAAAAGGSGDNGDLGSNGDLGGDASDEGDLDLDLENTGEADDGGKVASAAEPAEPDAPAQAAPPDQLGLERRRGQLERRPR